MESNVCGQVGNERILRIFHLAKGLTRVQAVAVPAGRSSGRRFERQRLRVSAVAFPARHHFQLFSCPPPQTKSVSTALTSHAAAAAPSPGRRRNPGRADFGGVQLPAPCQIAPPEPPQKVGFAGNDANPAPAPARSRTPVPAVPARSAFGFPAVPRLTGQQAPRVARRCASCCAVWLTGRPVRAVTHPLQLPGP